mgnify:CR=1 FL=1
MASKMRESGRKRAVGKDKAGLKLKWRKADYDATCRKAVNATAYKCPGQLNKH